MCAGVGCMYVYSSCVQSVHSSWDPRCNFREEDRHQPALYTDHQGIHMSTPCCAAENVRRQCTLLGLTLAMDAWPGSVVRAKLMVGASNEWCYCSPQILHVASLVDFV